MKIYGDFYSGNCYKVKLTCSLLSLSYDWEPVDILKGETLTESFLAMNPAGKIPVVETDCGEILTESNAIIYFLARDSHLWPSHTIDQARVLQWQFFEQYSHEPNIAVARFIKYYLNMPEHRLAEYQSKIKPGYRALDLMEKTLLHSPFLVGQFCSIADISLYAYTHVANQGGFDLDRYEGIKSWLKRMQLLDGFVTMDG